MKSRLSPESPRAPSAKQGRARPGPPAARGRSARDAHIAVFAVWLASFPATARPVRIALPDGRITVAQHGDATSLTLDLGRHRRAADLPKDEMVSAGTLKSARLIGAPARNLVLLLTIYASQTGIGGPDIQCAAGEEGILRVVALPSLRQTDKMRVESCWNDIYGLSLTWADPSGPLVIEGKSDVPDAYAVDAAGRFTRAPVPAPGAWGKVRVPDLQ